MAPAARKQMLGQGAIGRPLAICAIALGLMTTARVAHTDPSSAAINGAQVLVGEGRKLRDAGDKQGARERFESAYLLVRTPIIGLDLGRAREALGLLIEARAVLAESAALPPIVNESAQSQAARVEAQRLVTELDGRIPTLSIAVHGAPSDVKLSASIDGWDVPDLTAPRKVNPGTHVVVVRSGDHVERTQIDVAEKEAKTATVTFPVIEAPKPQPEPRRILRTSPLTYVGFAVAGVGILAGSVTGAIALEKAHKFSSSCEGFNFQCPTATRGDYDSSRRYGNASTISFAVAGVGLAVGVYGLLTREWVVVNPGPTQITLSFGVGSAFVRGAF